MTRNGYFIIKLLICSLTALSLANHISAGDSPLRIKTIVIDPGHGGKDPGCSRNGILEKNITLSVALKLGKIINDSLPGIKVLYTRTSDKFVELSERASVANSNHADIFISIHVNATKSTQPNGSETFCMGLNMSDENMEVCQVENSVITLEDDYTARYEGFDPGNPESYIIFSLLQNSNLEQSLKLAEAIQSKYTGGPIRHSRGVRQAGFVVLWRCTAPAVLTELGFLSNESDFRALSDTRKHNIMALSLFKAINSYRQSYEFRYDGTASEEPAHPLSSASTATSISASEPAPAVSAKNGFGIQIIASDRKLKEKDPALKGLKCEVIKKGNIYKYVTGYYKTSEEAEKDIRKIRKLFKDAFIVRLP